MHTTENMHYLIYFQNVYTNVYDKFFFKRGICNSGEINFSSSYQFNDKTYK